jgi:hypothetical protein
MRGTAVLDPYAVNSSNTTVDCRFAAVGETTEYSVVGGRIASISISKICCLGIIAAPTTTASPPATTPSLGALRLLGIVFSSDAFVTVLLGVISKSAVIARWRVVGLPRWKDTRMRSSVVDLNSVMVVYFNAKSWSRARKIEATGFLTYASFEFGYRHILDKSLFTLYPVMERRNWKGDRVEYD